MDEEVLLASIRFYAGVRLSLVPNTMDSLTEKMLIATDDKSAISLQWRPDQEKPDARMVGDYVYRIRQAFHPLKDRLPGDLRVLTAAEVEDQLFAIGVAETIAQAQQSMRDIDEILGWHDGQYPPIAVIQRPPAIGGQFPYWIFD